MTHSTALQGLLTVDLEDWYHANYDDVDPATWTGLESHVVAHTEILLEAFARAGVHATFFTLGCVADAHPGMMCAIRDAGHEIASHGYGHRKVSDLGPDGFRDDLRQAQRAIEAACGVRPVGFRAPSWSISPASWRDEGDNFWALRILREEGFEYDASLFPFKTYLYGVAGAPTRPHRIDLNGQDTLCELPASVAELPGLRCPFGGGFYLRLFPTPLTTFLCRTYLRTHDGPFMFYIHPREISDQQPRLSLGRKERFIHYYNLRANLGKVEHLLRQFRFGPVRDYLGTQSPSLVTL